MITRLELTHDVLYIDYLEDNKLHKVGIGIDCFRCNPTEEDVYINDGEHYWKYYRNTKFLIIDGEENQPFHINLSPDALPKPGYPKRLFYNEDVYADIKENTQNNLTEENSGKQPINESSSFSKNVIDKSDYSKKRDWQRERDEFAKELFIKGFISCLDGANHGKITYKDSANRISELQNAAPTIADDFIRELKNQPFEK